MNYFRHPKRRLGVWVGLLLLNAPTLLWAEVNHTDSTQQPQSLANSPTDTVQKAVAPLFPTTTAAGTVLSSTKSLEDTRAKTNVSPGSAADTVSVQDLHDMAFDKFTQRTLPMTPEQILKLRRLFNQTKAASVATPGTPPRPTISSQYIRLEPGSTPSVIRLAQGYVSTLAFIDSTGQPWPIGSYTIGDPKVFNIQWDKKSNLLMIQAGDLYKSGNLAVQLHGLTTPVMLTLVSGQKAVDYRVDLRINGAGPNAKTLLGRELPDTTNPELLSILDGVPPVGGAVLQISGGLAQAWLVGDRLFIRTRLTLLSPAWIATMSSPDGIKAYEMPKAPLILCSENGKVLQLKVEGF